MAIDDTKITNTNSWRKISQVPSYPITGRSIFAQGCLYWLVVIEREVPMDDDKYKVIWFDVTNEKFGMIDPPRLIKNRWIMSDQLVNLNGEVGFAYADCDLKVWALKQEKWVIRFQINRKPLVSLQSIWLIGCLNKAGHILITARILNQTRGSRRDNERTGLFVYKLQSGILDEVKIIGQEDIDIDDSDDIDASDEILVMEEKEFIRIY
ncbi:F-box domain containing protein [Tanacetum coccineum]